MKPSPAVLGGGSQLENGACIEFDHYGIKIKYNKDYELIEDLIMQV